MTSKATSLDKKPEKKPGLFGVFIKKVKMKLLMKFKKKDPNIYPFY